jgi:hypothetical protein
MGAADWTEPQDGDDYTDYRYFTKFYRALQDREGATANTFIFPRTSSAWKTGTVTGLTASVMTDSAADFYFRVSGSPCDGVPRWSGFSCPETVPWAFADYDLVLNAESRDETKIITVPIMGQPADITKLNIGPSLRGTLNDYITAGYIGSIGELVGTSYAIINRGGLWWNDRIPAYPNDDEYETGNASSVSVVNVSVSTGAIANVRGLTFVWTVSTVEHTATISDFAPTRVMIARQTPVPSGSFSIRNAEGTAIVTGSISSVVDGIQRGDPPFKADNLSGKDLLIYGGGALRRISVTEATPATVIFARQSFDFGGTFSIVSAGTRGWPGQTAGEPLLAYGGATMPHYTVRHDDNFTDPQSVSLIGAPVAQIPIQLPAMSGIGCETIYRPCYDIDYWIDADAECDTADECKSPHFWKTVRALKLRAEGICGSFVQPRNYTGLKEIHGFSTAELFNYIGVNNFSTTATATLTEDESASVATWGFSVPYANVGLHYAVIAAGNVRHAAGFTSTSGSLSLTFPASLAGTSLSLIGSWGWTQHTARRFLNAYGRTCFIPDYEIVANDIGIPTMTIYDPAEVADYCHENEEEPPEVCPRDCFGIGQWVYRGPSSCYAETDGTQFVVEGGQPFIIGELARYWGANTGDPGITPQTQPAGDGDPDIGYWRNFSEMRRRPEQHALMEEAKRGKATSGTTFSLTDTTKNWWAYPFGAGVMLTHSGTATSGGASSLTDSTIAVESDTNTRRCFFAADRFIGFSAPFAGFTLEVDKVSGATTTTHKVALSSANQSGVMNFPSGSGFTVATGDAYRLKEPSKGRLNWWQGRTVKIRKPDGTVFTRTIVANDFNSLFLSSPLAEPIGADWTYEIEELVIGGVYQWTAEGWKAPEGMDPRGQPFHKTVTENLPTNVVRYGLDVQGTEMTTVSIRELFKAIDALRWTFYAAGFTSRFNPTVAELNTWQPTQQLFDIGCVDLNDADQYTWAGTGEPILDEEGNPTYDEYGNQRFYEGLIGCYKRVTKSESDGAAPYWFCGGTLFPTSSSIGGGAAYAYGLIEGVPNKMARAFDFFAMGWIDGSNSEPLQELQQSCYTRYEPWNNIYHSGERNVHVTRLYDATSTGLTFRTFKQYSTIGPNQDTRVVSDRLGSNAPVAPVDKPMDFFYELRDGNEKGPYCAALEGQGAPCDGGPSGMCGHEYSEWETKAFGNIAAQNTVIVRWDVAGGMTYVT